MTKLDSDPQGTLPVGLHPEEIALRRFLERTQDRDASAAADVVRELRCVHLANQTASDVKTLGDLVPMDDAKTSALNVVVTADGRAVDVVVPEAAPGSPVEHLGAALDRTEVEWSAINVLVPLASLGAAHTACRDTAVTTVQPYWVSGATVVFGGQETP